MNAQRWGRRSEYTMTSTFGRGMSVRGAAGVAAGGNTATIDGAEVAPSGVVRDGFVSAMRGLVASARGWTAGVSEAIDFASSAGTRGLSLWVGMMTDATGVAAGAGTSWAAGHIQTTAAGAATPAPATASLTYRDGEAAVTRAGDSSRGTSRGGPLGCSAALLSASRMSDTARASPS